MNEYAYYVIQNVILKISLLACFKWDALDSIYVYSLPVTYDKLQYMLNTSTKLVSPWRWQDIWSKHVGALYNNYKNNLQLVGSEICV